MKAIQVTRTGGPEVLVLGEVADPAAGPGQALVRVQAAGLNYIDTYHRTGLYPLDLPFVPGLEGAGTIEALGDGVSDLAVGDRVAWAMAPGSYAERVAVPAGKLVRLPDGVDARSGAAAMLQGMTAHYLSHSTFPLESGHRALVHAAAGGVGLLLVQMARMRGATVYGTVSTEQKARLAKEAGADAVIRYTEQDFESEIERLTDGEGVDVVYDSVAATTYLKSMNCLKRRGTLVLFGQSSGPIRDFDPVILSQKGSLYMTRPTLADYVATREDLLARAGDVLGWIGSGRLGLRVDRTCPLAQAGDAHRALESRQTAGKVLLEP